MRSVYPTLASLVLLAACGPSFEPLSTVSGPFVNVRSYDFEPGDIVTVGEHSATVGDDHRSFRLEIPAAALGEGEHTLSVQLDRGGTVVARELTVEVPAKALEPYLRIGPCDSMIRGADAISANLTSDAWVQTGTSARVSDDEIRCRLERDTAVPVTANHGATVTIHGQPVEMTKGRGSWSGGQRLFFNALTLEHMNAPTAAPSEPHKVQAVLALDGHDPVTYDIAVTVLPGEVRRSISRIVRSIEPGEPPPFPRTAHDGPPRSAVLVSKLVSLTVDGEERGAVPGAYSSPLGVGQEGSRADQLDLFAVATPTDLTELSPCVYVAVTGGRAPRNVRYSMGLDVVVFDPAGEEVARKSFSKPQQPSCPGHLSSVDGKTVLLTAPPSPSQVLAWLEEVRAR